MPIRINFLAEQQEAEEMRRRDPLKRALVLAGLAVLAVLGVAGVYWGKGSGATAEAKGRADHLAGLQKDANLVKTNQARITDLNNKLKSLESLAAARSLWGTQLNALQNCVVDDVQLSVAKANQTFEEFVEKGPDGKPRGTKAIERGSLTLTGRDTSRDGEAFNRFKEQIQNNAHFKPLLSKKGVTLQEHSKNPDRALVTFTLVVSFQEKSL